MIIELDAMLIVEMINNSNHSPNGNNNIVADCREGLSRIPRVQVAHCFREANKYAMRMH